MSLSRDVLNAVNSIERELEVMLSRWRHDIALSGIATNIKSQTDALKASVVAADVNASAAVPVAQVPAPAVATLSAQVQTDTAPVAEKF